jgi:glycosyltransferase involved in cell wall biosynthesis
VTQQADPEHPVLGATVAQIAALAKRVDEVLVLANGDVVEGLPANVRVQSFRAPTKAARTARYLRALVPAVARRPVAVLAHMSPVYAVLAAPFARPLRVPVLLWFTQARGGKLLRAAEPLVTAILTVDRRSVPLDSPKVRAIGHGIDVAAFPPIPDKVSQGTLRLLGLGRYAPVKGWDVVLRALAELPDAKLTIHGSQLTDADRANRAALERLARELGVDGRVTLADPVPRRDVARLFADADAVVNPTRGNAADKVVFEAAAAGVPVLAASPVFDSLLPAELRFADAHQLAERLRALDPSIGVSLREKVEAQHSVEHWADGVLEAAR